MMTSRILLTASIVLLTAFGAVAQRKSSKTKAKAPAERVSDAALLKTISEKFDAYEFQSALEDLEKYRDMKNASEETADRLEQRLLAGNSMLERVEKIAVIDSIVVDKADFFKAYNLNPSAGSLESVAVLPADFEADSATAVYATENGLRRLWGAPQADGHIAIVESSMLADGSWEAPQPLDESVNAPGARRVNYPFVMADGITLYYASDNPDESLGGYDIFITRFDGEKYLEPQNVGMPYNSVYDDYLLAIDETTGAGWWATDRNRLGDKLTVYVFVPSELRVNYPLDTPGLTGLAKLTNIAATQPKGADYSALLHAIHTPVNRDSDGNDDFEFALPDGSVIRSLDRLRSEAARNALEDYLDRKDSLSYLLIDLADMRKEYADGNTGIADRILEAEQEELRIRAELRRLANIAVNAAMRDR